MVVMYKMFKNIVSPFVGKGLGKHKALAWSYHTLANRLVPYGEKIVELDGYKLKVNLRRGKDLDGVAQQLIFTYEYEPGTTKIVKQILKEGMTAIDVGANIGYFTYLMSILVGSGGVVYTFEPEPDNYRILIENWVLNHSTNVETSNLAISNTNGFAYLNISHTESGEHSLEPATREYPNKIRVNTTKLDFYSPMKVDLIKVDVEGHEVKVLEGTKDLLTLPINDDLKLIIEFWPEGLMKVDPSEPYRIFPILNNYGYKYVYIIREQDGTLIPTDIRGALEYCSKIGFSTNLLCSRSKYD